ncbi:MAG TPA: IS630 family transposase, partial [Rectinemataceae bacterium]
DEHLNADLKHGVGSRTPVRTKANLKASATNYMAMLRQSPERIISYFQDPAIRYASISF